MTTGLASARRCCAGRTSGISTAAANSCSDIKLPGTMDVAFVRSPHAHARIRSIAVPPEARGRVFTAADLPRIKPIRVVTHAAGAKSPPWPPLATDKVRYVGEAIAACVAPTRGEAEDLANAVTVDFEVLDAVVDAPRDMRGSRHPVHESWGDNLYVERTVLEGGDIDAAARAAEVTMTREFRMNRQSGAPLETPRRCSPIATTVSTRSSSMPRPRRRTRSAWRSPRSSISKSAASASSRPMSAAGLGRRRASIPEEIILAALALELDHPVRWIEDRNEHLLTTAHTRDHHYKVTAYADRQGRILGVDAEIIVDARRLWVVAAGTLPGSQHGRRAPCRAPTRSRITGRRPIRWRRTRRRSAPIAGSAAPAPVLRSSGLIDESRAGGRPRARSRCARLNMIRPEQMPFTSIGGMRYDSGDYAAERAAVRRTARYAGDPRAAAAAASRTAG